MPVPITYHPLQPSFVRIFVCTGASPTNPCGAGVALADGRVLTCAHVVSSALGMGRTPPVEKPTGELMIDFPLTDSAKIIKAGIKFWEPSADLAVLEVIDPFPISVKAARLLATPHLLENRIRAFGFQAHYEQGNWANGILKGPNIDGWLEIVDLALSGHFIHEGFSGGPVWDETYQCCIGIIVAVDSDPVNRTGYLIPAGLIAEKLQTLQVEYRQQVKQNNPAFDLLPYMPNRKTQDKAFLEKFQKLDNVNPKPMISIVYGHDRQCIDSYVQRIQWKILPSLLLNISEIKLIDISLQDKLESIGTLEEELIGALSREILQRAEPASISEIQNRLTFNPKPLILYFELQNDIWLRDGSKLIQKFLDFWQKWPALVPGQNLFIFVKLHYQTFNKNGFWALQQNIRQGWRKNELDNYFRADPFAAYNRLICAVLPELEDVLYEHAKYWAKHDAAQYLGGDIEEVLHRIRCIFDSHNGHDTSGSLSMFDLAQGLKQILISYSA